MTSHMWHLLPGRCWPLLAEEEAIFVSELSERARESRPALKPQESIKDPLSRPFAAGYRPSFDRDTLSILLGALRCGTKIEDLFSMIHGLDPFKMLTAYEHIDAQRSEAVSACKKIIADPSLNTVTACSSLAVKVLPVAISRIALHIQDFKTPDLVRVVSEAALQIAEVSMFALAIESHLRTIKAPSLEGIALGRCLYDPYDPQLWSHPYYLPERVGSLMPSRVADLLGEKR